VATDALPIGGESPWIQRLLPLPFPLPLRGRGGGRLPAGRVEPCEAREVEGVEPPAGDLEPSEAALATAAAPAAAFVFDPPAPGRITPEEVRTFEEPRPGPPVAPAIAAAMAGVKVGPRSPRASRRWRMVT